MKKALSLAIAMVLACVFTIPVLATNANGGDTLITYNVASSYVVIIPPSITVSSGTGADEYGVASGSLIEAGKKLVFTITEATNYDTVNNKFRMINSADSTIYLGYSIKDEANNDVVMNTPFLNVLSSEANAGKKIRLTYSTDNATVAGTYTDMVTITVAMANAN